MPLCEPDLLLKESDLEQLVHLPGRREELKALNLQEYRAKRRVIDEEIERIRAVNPIPENSDSSDLPFNEVEAGDESSLETRNGLPQRRAHCPHRSAYFHKRLLIRDSFMIVRTALGRGPRRNLSISYTNGQM